mmetsp:Transcript_11309/g.26010  ORF Transcript_11309/g.26010 Transcript_11309/m.26010 type:complete len:565 (-) Transcript_11309:125-1819(-)|eukprot:CAMPEP_0178424902 /NCGR_PEP_ID=MMETSP0689_2-20121128/28449_1 /TAXON_ID=160604 /ORGANISM="Amphidinium massartii, Strain CS-259" /LENGTH=564 /DNA_ID=CAMNT_0020046553 /DNA_START=85 /DNA_END=1779 /DNA_ORIENTATION=+
MTFYYNPARPLIVSALGWKAATFRIIVRRFEFWFYIALHVALLLILKLSDFSLGGAFPFEATTPVSFFMIFMIIFYNGQCYDRYQEFYVNVMNCLHSAVFFVHELCVTFHYPEVEKHRITATRFIMAAVFIFYMNVTGGMPGRNEWNEVITKGLLMPWEVRLLQEYPGGRVTLILTSWALRAVQAALVKDCFFQEHSPHIAHVHNRLNEHVHRLVISCNRISYLLALPIPFPYFHLLNIVLNCNFGILAVALATFEMYSSIVAYAFALLIFMGIREVSNSLADPFGTDDVDFPVEQFLDHTFNDAMGLLEAFSNPAVHERVVTQISECPAFTDRQLLHQIKEEMLYEKNFHINRDNPFAWDRLTPLQHWKGRSGLREVLWTCLVQPFDPKAPIPEVDQGAMNGFFMEESANDVDLQLLDSEKDAVKALKQEVRENHLRIDELRQQLARLSTQPVTNKVDSDGALKKEPSSTRRVRSNPSAASVLGTSMDANTWASHQQIRQSISHTQSKPSNSTSSQKGPPRLPGTGVESFDEARARIRALLRNASSPSATSSPASSVRGHRNT